MWYQHPTHLASCPPPMGPLKSTRLLKSGLDLVFENSRVHAILSEDHLGRIKAHCLPKFKNGDIVIKS